jgi:hypothetical protein
VLIRDAEWIVRRVDRTGTGGQSVQVVGASEIVRNREARFLSEIEGKGITVLDPAETELDELKTRSTKEYIGAFDIAVIYVGLHDKDSAMQWLEKAYDERTMRLEQVTEPAFDSLRSDPRFIDLEKRIGLPPRRYTDFLQRHL